MEKNLLVILLAAGNKLLELMRKIREWFNKGA